MGSRADLNRNHITHITIIDQITQDLHHIGDKNNYYFLKKLQKNLVV
jgi:hypothetical protein